MRKSTIYVLADPREVEPEKRFRYVGKTITKLNVRLSGHVSDAKHSSRTHVRCWINQVLKDDEYTIILELEVTDEEHDCDREIHWIAHFREEGFYLCNHTDGGEGRTNSSPSEETRRKISESLRKLNRTGEKAPFYGYKHSQATKQKMSERMTGDKNPIYGKGEDRKGEKNWFYGKKHDAAAKRKMSACNKGKNNPNYGKITSEETRRKISEAHKGRITSEETRRKLSEAGKNRKVSSETRRKISETLKNKKRKTP